MVVSGCLRAQAQLDSPPPTQQIGTRPHPLSPPYPGQLNCNVPPVRHIVRLRFVLRGPGQSTVNSSPHQCSVNLLLKVLRVQRTIKTSKNTVRTGAFVGQAVRYPINSVPKPGGPSLRRSQKKCGPNGSIRWTTHSSDTGGGGRGGWDHTATRLPGLQHNRVWGG